MPAWTADDIPDLAGRTAVVTGASSGLGLQTALQLAAHRATVVLAVRDEGRGQAAVDRIRTAAPDADARVAHLDLTVLASVRSFADRVQGEHPAIDLLVNNAGIMALPRRTTADGFESQLATNHLGHFALTGLLLPALLSRPGARVVTVSSMAAQGGRIAFDDLQGERRYQRWLAYCQSKLANQLFAFELARRIERAGVALRSVAAHPGYSATNLQGGAARLSGSAWGVRVTDAMNRVFAQPDADGALPQLYAATAPGALNGDYIGPGQWWGMRGAPARVTPPSRARSEADAHRLWSVSEELTGVSYGRLDVVG